jgi:hypothetical protein
MNNLTESWFTLNDDDEGEGAEESGLERHVVEDEVEGRDEDEEGERRGTAGRGDSNRALYARR